MQSPADNVMNEFVKRIMFEERRFRRKLEQLVQLDPSVEFRDFNVMNYLIFELTSFPRKV